MRVAFYTLGCKVNHYETEAMSELFRAEGHQVVPFSHQADIYIVNTCTVTQMSDKKSRQMLSRAHNNNPAALVVAVGCYAQTSRKTVKNLSGVSLVIGNEGKKDIVSLCKAALNAQAPAPALESETVSGVKTHHSLPATEGETLSVQAEDEPLGAKIHHDLEFEELSATHDSRTRATLKIQDGCDRFCSYCIIPYARGNLRSRTMESCAREISALVEGGYKEIVLTGIQLCAYRDGESTLLDVIRLCDELKVRRLRLGSLEPTFITPEAVKVFKGSRCLCHQFHLSLQSGSDTVLRRMNRRYTLAQYEAAVTALKTAMPDTAITTDIICGFVGETTKEHEESLAFVRKIGFSRVHVFPYSKREGTRAAAMPDHLPKHIKENRTRDFLRLANQLEQEFLQAQEGTCHEVLMEEDGTGYTKNYVRVRLDAEEGELINVLITGHENNLALGKKI